MVAQLVVSRHIACMCTLEFSPEQGQSAAVIEGPNAAVLEQGFELGMEDMEVSRWAEGLGRTKVALEGRHWKGSHQTIQGPLYRIE